jgi:UDP-GlcNAc3NAcA epimerase
MLRAMRVSEKVAGSPMKTVMTIAGARPQFIKAAGILRAFEHHDAVRMILTHTGQHYDTNMSAIFFDELGIRAPDHDLGISGGGHGDMTGRMMAALEPVMIAESPSAVIVFGDTNSTLAAALTAAKLGIPVAHVEAGVRSFNRRMPEEINRVLTDHVSQWLFCPTHAAVRNLAAEGITRGALHTGDVMYDVLLDTLDKCRRQSRIIESLALVPDHFAVATVHRPETTNDPAELARVFAYLAKRAKARPLIMPLHPRTRHVLEANRIDTGAMRMIEPLGYVDMIRLVDGAAEVLTDSGGLQKDAYFLRKPCVTLRTETEWNETIDAGWNRLWSVDTYLPRRDFDEGEFGHGQASATICKALLADIL